MQGHTGKHQAQEAEKSGGGGWGRGDVWTPAFIVVFVGRNGKALALDSFNNFSRLWARGVVSNCLVPGPGVIWGRGLLAWW